MFDRHSLRRSVSRAAILTMSSVLFLAPTLLFAGEEECGEGSPAHPVPQTRPGMAGGESLWPTDLTGAVTFRPVSNSSNNPYPIPAQRDSTSYITQTIPGNNSGHELFMDVASIDGNDDWLFVAYNAGIQVWDLRDDAANPDRTTYRDGWQGHFEEFPEPGEVDTYIDGLDVLQTGGDIFLGVVGRSGHGFSFWEFNSPATLTQHCQVSDISARQVELIEHNGRAYAFVAVNNGTYVYDLDSSLSGTCAFEGTVGATSDGNYVSVLQKDGDVFVAAADGSLLPSDPLGVKIWEVDPEDPGSARELFSGFNTNSRGVTMFEIPGAVDRYFLGVIETSTQLKFYDIEACLEVVGPGTCGSLGSPLATVGVDNIGKSYEFIDISTSADGRTWGYYGFMTTPGLFGTNFEYLLDLTPLGSTTLEDVETLGQITLDEITDDGDTYNNENPPCTNTAAVDYWGDYYPKNQHGLNFFIPRHAIFIDNKLYRAAYSILDVHEIVNVQAVQSIATSLTGGASTIWSDETATYTGTPGGSCSPTSGDWCWVVEVAGSDVSDDWAHTPDFGNCSSSYTNPESFDYSCTPGAGQSRCDPATAIVTAWNTGCGPFPPANNQTSSVEIEVKDPTVDIEGDLDTGGTTYQQCQVVDMTATLGGRGPIDWEWQIDGEPLDGCSGSVSLATDISGVDPQCLWDTSGVQLGDEIFADGFETGDVSRWSSSSGLPKAARSSHYGQRAVDFAKGGATSVNVDVSLVVSNGTVLDTESVTITIEEIGVPAFVNPGDPISSNVVGNVATITAAANNTSTWTWEIEDPTAGTAACSFDGAAMCVTVETITDTIEYAWTVDGTYDFEVSISNCQFGDSETAAGSVTVSAAVTPVITTFRFNPSTATDFCCGSPFAGFECQSGVEIEFEVQMTEEAASFDFAFDWERTSQASANFVSQAETGNSGTTYSFSHTFSNSGSQRSVFPIVQVTSGLATDEEDFYTSDDSITVLANGQSCN